ncbi:MAG: DUF6933 domain-containing protein [bacterium]
MVVLRATRKVLRLLPPSSGDEVPSGAALGDWYLNRFVVDHRPLLLIVSSTSLLAILTHARDVRNLPLRIQSLVAERLVRLGIAQHLIDAEVAAMHPVHVGPARDRSVLGSLVQFAKDTSFYLPIRDWDDLSLLEVEDRLAETPWRTSSRVENTIFPNLAVPRLLQAKWA